MATMALTKATRFFASLDGINLARRTQQRLINSFAAIRHILPIARFSFGQASD
jgi:hypothetical protein